MSRPIDHATAAGSRPVEMTREQRAALQRKWDPDASGMTWQAFLESAQPTIGCDGAIVARWCGMWLCIERDGYCHT